MQHHPSPAPAASATADAGPSAAQRTGLWLGPVLAGAVLTLPLQPHLAPEGQAVLALLVLMAVWWISEAVPLAVTALLPIVALPLMGIEVVDRGAGRLVCATAGACAEALAEGATVRVLAVTDLAQHYSSPIVLLYIGGFFLGQAVAQSGLSARIAYAIVAGAGPRPGLILGGVLAATAAISMWISNTATALIMTPLALAIAAGATLGGGGNPKFARALVLGVCYAATIGGLATPVGTPPNLIALQQMRSQGVEVGFGQWMAFGVPVMLVLLAAAFAILGRGVRLDASQGAAAAAAVQDARARLGQIKPMERRVGVIFVLVALMWAGSEPLSAWLGPALMGARLPAPHLDTIVALAGAVALFVVPAGGGQKRALLTWGEASTIPWGVLLLFGGGLALAAGAEASGLTGWLADGLRGLSDAPPLLTLLALCALVIVLTEFASNIATISLMGPVVLSLVADAGVASPAAFIVPVAMAASMGFAMPVGSAANAIAYATGKVRQGEMIRLGLMMNTAALVVIVIAGLTLAPAVFGAPVEVGR